MPPTYSLVVPIFNEETVIPILLRRLDALLEALDAPGEVIVVDDGSADTSAIVIEAKARADKRYRLIKLSRNFGHQIAITSGLDHAAGRAVIVMDADLQEGLILSGGLISLRPLRFRLDGRGFRSSRSSLSPHVVDHETAHDRAERQAVGVCPRICSPRHFDFEHEGKKRPVGGADQPPLVSRFA